MTDASQTTERISGIFKGLYRSIYVFGFRVIRQVILFFKPGNGNIEPILLSEDIDEEALKEIEIRLSYYLPGIKASQMSRKAALRFGDIFSRRPVLLFGSHPGISPLLRMARGRIYDVDYRQNASDAWDWIDFTNQYSPPGEPLQDRQEIFREHVQQLHSRNLQKCYVFGTGPSLEKAYDLDFSDGYVVVCNTIVRDAELWKKLNPDFIVAGDAIYHFGHTSFARAFRKDLIERLHETNTLFVYPKIFDTIVRRELRGLEKQLIPVPIGGSSQIHKDLTKDFSLPRTGNVLPLLLLPVGCTLSKNIFLLGFDGRAPDDKLFWSNSTRHSYPELMPELVRSHPKFYEQNVPKSDPNRYVQQVHGDMLDRLLTAAEEDGFTFEMLHKSWTPTLQKRYRAG